MNNSKSAVVSVVYLLVVLILFLQVQTVVAQSGDTMIATFEKSTQIWNQGKLDLIDEVYAKDAVRHGVDGEDVVGAEALKAYIGRIRTVYPDFNVVLNKKMATDDMAIIHWTVTGTNKGALSEEIPATGKAVTISGVTLAKYKDGKITEEWAYWNHGGAGSVMAQLGFSMQPPMMAGKQ